MIIYKPKGKAGEYAKYACNFYIGCSNGCTYCHLKKGILAKGLGGDIPQLRKCFKDENHALEIFEKELKKNLEEYRKHGIFFSFATDPMLNETSYLTFNAVLSCVTGQIPCFLLTKKNNYEKSIIKRYNSWFNYLINNSELKEYVHFGFTLTGHDELEPNASTNAERIIAMKQLHEVGFKTWASIEPVIDLSKSLDMIAETQGFCDHYKIGLESGKKYDKIDLQLFLKTVVQFKGTFYFKDDLLKKAGYDRREFFK